MVYGWFTLCYSNTAMEIHHFQMLFQFQPSLMIFNKKHLHFQMSFQLRPKFLDDVRPPKKYS